MSPARIQPEQPFHDANLDDAHHAAAFVAAQFHITVFHDGHNVAGTIDTSDPMGYLGHQAGEFVTELAIHASPLTRGTPPGANSPSSYRLCSNGETMKPFLVFVLAVALAAVAMADVDVTGKWSGTLDLTGQGETNQTTACSCSSDRCRDHWNRRPQQEQQFPIQKGKIEADVITLEADHDGHTMTLDLKLVSGRITGDVRMPVTARP